MPVPHDRQLHRQAVNLHPFVGILEVGEEKQTKKPNPDLHGAQRWGGDGMKQEVVPQVVNKRIGAVSYRRDHH